MDPRVYTMVWVLEGKINTLIILYLYNSGCIMNSIIHVFTDGYHPDIPFVNL